MNFRTFGIVRAAEEMEDEVVTTEGGDEGLEMDADVVEQEANIDAADAASDAAVADVETLEEIKDVLEEAAEEGDGIDETAAKIVEVAVESIYARLGMEYRGLGTSAESFSSSRSRVTATKIAAEGIADSAKRAWEAIKKFFKKIWDYIKDFAKSIFTSIGRLKAAAASMEKKLSKAGKDKRDDTFTSSFIVANFTDNGNLSTPDEIANSVTDVKTGLDRITALKKAIESGVKSSSGPDKAEAFKKMGVALTKPMSATDKAVTVAGIDTTKEDAHELFITPTGRAVILTLPNDKIDSESKSSKTTTRARVESVSIFKSTEDSNMELSVPEISKMRNIVNAVSSMADAADKANKDEKYLKSIDKLIDDMRGNLEVTVDDRTSKVTNADMNETLAYVRAMLSIGKGVSTKPISEAVKSGFATLKYVSAVMGQYK